MVMTLLALLLASILFVGAIYNIVKLAQEPSGLSFERFKYTLTAIVYTFFLIIILLGIVEYSIKLVIK